MKLANLVLVTLYLMIWKDAVAAAIGRHRLRHNTRTIERQSLIDEEMAQINADTATTGATPSQTLSRVLQDLRDDGFIAFIDKGTYFVLDAPFFIEEQDLPDETLDEIILNDRLIIGSVDTDDVQVLSRRRRGQKRLHDLTLDNYGGKCALCDITDTKLLVASHIVRWADDSVERGNLSNIICLCQFHDTLFESGYIAFSDNLDVLKKTGIQEQVIASLLSATNSFRRPSHHAPRPELLKRHRLRVGFQT